MGVQWSNGYFTVDIMFKLFNNNNIQLASLRSY